MSCEQATFRKASVTRKLYSKIESIISFPINLILKIIHNINEPHYIVCFSWTLCQCIRHKHFSAFFFVTGVADHRWQHWCGRRLPQTLPGHTPPWATGRQRQIPTPVPLQMQATHPVHISTKWLITCRSHAFVSKAHRLEWWGRRNFCSWRTVIIKKHTSYVHKTIREILFANGRYDLLWEFEVQYTTVPSPQYLW